LLQLQFEVAFREPGIVDGEPLLETLQQMITAEQFISSFRSVLK
jgi:hypothetical protein